MKFRSRIKTVTFSMLSLIMGFSMPVISQSSPYKGSFSTSWFTFFAPRQEITPYYDATRKDVSISSSPRMSFAGKLQYNYPLNKHLDLSLGVVVGSYPFDVNYSYDSVFSITGRGYSDFSYDKYSSIYGGIGLSFTYFKHLNEKHSLAFRLGCNYTIFIPQFYIYSSNWLTDTGTIYQTLFFDANMNPEEKGFLAPEISLQYYYKVTKWIVPFISITGVYSNNYPIVGNRYILFGKTENLEGTFRRRFLQAGIDIGVKVNLPNSKKK